MNFTQSAAEHALSFPYAENCYIVSLQIQKDSVSLLKPWERGARVLQGFVPKVCGNLGVMFLWI